MKKILFAIILAALFLPSLTFAAGSVTQTLAMVGNNTGKYIWTLTWTADAADHTVPNTAMSADILAVVEGFYIEKVTTNPGATAPTDDYDITIEDTDGVDLMGGALLNRDTSTSESAYPIVATGVYGAVPFDGAPTVKWAGNSVNSATGTIKIFLSR